MTFQLLSYHDEYTIRTTAALFYVIFVVYDTREL